jgi:hypothetical protein
MDNPEHEPDLAPSGAESALVRPTTTEVRMHLQRWHADSAATAAKLHALRAEVDANIRQLEDPKSAYELIDFFADFFLGSSEDFDRLALELERGVAPEHATGLRQLAMYAAGDQVRARCLRYLDRCINRTLAYETQRPLLKSVLDTVRDQLDGYTHLNELADALDAISPPPAPPPATLSREDTAERTLDRRALFTRFFRR